MGYRYPDNLVETFAKLNLDKNVKIIDIASGPGNVPYFLKNHGYTNVDGLDPSQGLLDQGTKRGLFKWDILSQKLESVSRKRKKMASSDRGLA